MMICVLFAFSSAARCGAPPTRPEDSRLQPCERRNTVIRLAITLAAYRKWAFSALAGYWLTVAVARTTGTAIGDWLAESPIVNLGLPLATMLTGAALAAVLVLWPGGRPQAVLAETPA